MTRLAEIGHVLVKDVQESRRLLLLYLAIVVVATLHSVGLGVLAAGTFGASMVFVIVVGALLAASVVQADSPTRTDAFWAAHPFRRSSMLGAKVAFALLLVLIAAAGQTIGVHSYDLHGLALGRLVLEPVFFFCVTLLGVMLVASITRDLRSFIIAAVAIPLAVLFTMAVIGQYVPDVYKVRTSLQVIGLLAAATLLAWLYLTRDSRRRTRLVTCAVVASTVMSMCADTSTPRASAREISITPPLTITLEPYETRIPRTPGEMPLAIRVTGVEEGMRVRVEVPFADIRLRNGSVFRVPLQNADFLVGETWPFWVARPRIPGVRWVGEAQRRDAVKPIALLLTSAQSRALATEAGSITIDGRVSLWESRASETMPLVPGSVTTANGGRTRVVEWTPDDKRSTVVIDATRIDTTTESDRREMSLYEAQGFALVNQSRREATPLRRTTGSGGVDGLVLPGLPLESNRAHFGLRIGLLPDTATVDAEWLRGARLMRITGRFLGSYGIRLRSTDWTAAVGASRIPTPAWPAAGPLAGSIAVLH